MEVRTLVGTCDDALVPPLWETRATGGEAVTCPAFCYAIAKLGPLERRFLINCKATGKHKKHDPDLSELPIRFEGPEGSWALTIKLTRPE